MAARSTPDSPLARHPMFSPWRDPQSSVLTYILTERVAPVQQAFYFVNCGISADEEWMWFYTGFPPGGAHMLGAVCLDPDKPEIRHFPGAQFTAETPLLTTDGQGCYFAHGPDIWLQPLDGQPKKIAMLPEAIAGRRRLHRLATHLTVSSDGKYFLVDIDIGNEWIIALLDRGNGEWKVVKRFGRKYNHAQFSFHDPNLFLVAQDWWHDTITGQFYNFDWRTWLMSTDGQRFDPVISQGYFQHGGNACHEWWTRDGKLCWVDYEKGVMEISHPAADSAGAAKLVWGPRPLCHAQCDLTGRFWCADQTPYQWHERPCEVLFYDRETKQEIAIASAMPNPPHPRGLFHIDPHPQFSPRGTYVCYTTTVLGKVDVALTPVAGITGRMADAQLRDGS